MSYDMKDDTKLLALAEMAHESLEAEVTVPILEEKACGCTKTYDDGETTVWLKCRLHALSLERPKTDRRYYLKASVVEAEELPSGRWRVTGRGWLANGVEFSDEDFRRNFEAL